MRTPVLYIQLIFIVTEMKNWEVLFKNIDTLGEGPILDYKNNQVYWVDIRSKCFHTYSFKSHKLSRHELDRSITSISPSLSGSLYCTSGHEYYRLYRSDLSKFEMELISEVEMDLEDNRFNDGKAGPDGNYWAGTMDNNERSSTGSMYILSPRSPPKKIISDLIVSNGLAWDTENYVFFLADSARRTVRAYRYDDSFNILKSTITVRFDESEGLPDGMTIDADGYLWIAHWDGGKVSKWDPKTHKKMLEISLPARNITSCCFCGKDLDKLFITSAKLNQSPIVRQYDDPGDMGGSVFLVDTGIRGTRPFNLDDL